MKQLFERLHRMSHMYTLKKKIKKPELKINL